MEIDDVKQLRGKLEGDIRHLIRKFEEETGVDVTSVRLDHAETVGERRDLVEVVEVDLNL